MTVFAAVYALFPMLTNNLELRFSSLTKLHFWSLLIGGVGMSVAMGFAGMNGMLRRTVYEGDATFQGEMTIAAIFGGLILVSYLAMMFNIISTVGVRGLIEIFVRLPRRRKTALASDEA